MFFQWKIVSDPKTDHDSKTDFPFYILNIFQIFLQGVLPHHNSLVFQTSAMGYNWRWPKSWVVHLIGKKAQHDIFLFFTWFYRNNYLYLVYFLHCWARFFSLLDCNVKKVFLWLYFISPLSEFRSLLFLSLHSLIWYILIIQWSEFWFY